MPLHAHLHACYFTLRSGGKTLITFLFDSISIWAINYTLVFSLTHWAPMLSVPMIMLCDHLSNVVKCVVGSILVEKRIWVNNLVGDKVADGQ